MGHTYDDDMMMMSIFFMSHTYDDMMMISIFS